MLLAFRSPVKTFLLILLNFVLLPSFFFPLNTLCPSFADSLSTVVSFGLVLNLCGFASVSVPMFCFKGDPASLPLSLFCLVERGVILVPFLPLSSTNFTFWPLSSKPIRKPVRYFKNGLNRVL